MSTDMTWQTESISSDATEQLAASLGANLKGGEVIELIGDLGAGKTTFVRGLAKGAGSTDKVASPTFTISKVYEAGKLAIHHFDFYRLHEAGVVGNELAEAISDMNTVVVIEWGEVVSDILPPDRLTIMFSSPSEMKRKLEFTYTENQSYLLQGVRQ